MWISTPRIPQLAFGREIGSKMSLNIEAFKIIHLKYNSKYLSARKTYVFKTHLKGRNHRRKLHLLMGFARDLMKSIYTKTQLLQAMCCKKLVLTSKLHIFRKRNGGIRNRPILALISGLEKKGRNNI